MVKNELKTSYKALLLLLIFSLLALNLPTAAAETRAIKNRIKALLPENSMLRDYERLPERDEFLVIYIIDPKIANHEPGNTYSTCPPMVNGQPIKGEYHLALYENGDFVNDTTIPRNSPWELGIVYRQTKSNINNRSFEAMNPGDGNGNSYEMKKVKLLDLEDLTGDGLPYEFKIEVFGGACGHKSVLIGGYCKEKNRAMVYPILGNNPFRPFYWHNNFHPNENGVVKWELQCADHGNDVYEREKFVFSEKRQAYILTERERMRCEKKHDWWSG